MKPALRDHHDPQLRQMTGDSAMAEHLPGDPVAGSRFVRLDDGDLHVAEDGRPGAPAALLIHGTAGSAPWQDPVVPALAGACRVIRADLPGHGRSSSPAGGYGIPAHARRTGAALDRLQPRRIDEGVLTRDDPPDRGSAFNRPSWRPAAASSRWRCYARLDYRHRCRGPGPAGRRHRLTAPATSPTTRLAKE